MTTFESDHQHTHAISRHCSDILVPAVVEDPLMRPSTSCMDALFPNTSTSLSTYIIHVNAALNAINVAVERDSTAATSL